MSFCDQLKPQLLVDMMVSVSKRHPDLPIFDSLDWASHVPHEKNPEDQLPHPSLQHAAYQRRRHGHTVQPNKPPRQRHSNKLLKKIVKLVVPATDAAADNESLAEEAAAEEDENSLPPTWPKAGEGMYAKLAPEVDDREFLADENDEEAFSHFMVDKFGRQIIDSAVITV